LLVDGKPLIGRSPRYCTTTGELFFSQPAGDTSWQLAVLKDYWPHGRPVAASAGAPPPGFTQLFNGRDLSGWQVLQTTGNGANDQSIHRPGSGGWEVVDGALKCTTAIPGWLKTNREYENFELHVDFILPATRNSGIYIRTPDSGHLSNVGMEVQLLESSHPLQTAGAIARVAAATQSNLKLAGQWNHMEITCDGDKVRVKLNDVLVTDTDMSTNAALRDRPRRGFIGLANWMGQAQGVEFRNIFIKELTATNSSTASLPQVNNPASAPGEPVAFNGKWYRYYPEVLSWKEARAKCVALGGELAVIESDEENWFIGQHVAAAGGIEAWIGATDETNEGVWTTPSGGRLVYVNWAKSQPNNKGSGEHYGIIIRAMNWAWSDQPNVSDQHRPGFVCKWDAAPASASAAPSGTGWTELFNGRDLAGWQNIDGSPAGFRVASGYAEVAGGSIRTVAEFGPDFELYLEFWLPSQPQRSGQARANSGVYLTGRHEIQICDAYNNPVPAVHTCGAIYGAIGPSMDATQPPETWQSFLIRYAAPRWTTSGALQTAGVISVVHNGKQVIRDAQVSDATSLGAPIRSPGSRGPIVLQDHGSPVRFRNIRIREL
jgi:hypothetical protein